MATTCDIASAIIKNVIFRECTIQSTRDTSPIFILLTRILAAIVFNELVSNIITVICTVYLRDEWGMMTLDPKCIMTNDIQLEAVISALLKKRNRSWNFCLATRFFIFI